MKKIILSIDGGGVRGIVPAIILDYLEKKIKELLNDKRIKIVDLIDFVGGTSTGSIVGSLMLIPSDECTGAKHGMADIVELYFNFAEGVFKTKFWHNIKTLWGLIGPKFPEENIEFPLLTELGFNKLNDLIKPCMFTGYDIVKRKVLFYTNKDKTNKYGEYFIKDVVRGSTSIPPYFEPAYFNYGVDVNTIIDGGMFANNPALSSMIEASKTFKIKPKSMLIISLGTGKTTPTKYSYKKIKKWGIVKWLIPLINVLLASHAEVTAYQMAQICKPENYKRINPPIILASNNALDSSKENLMNLAKDAEAYINKNMDMLDNLAQEIIDLNYKFK